jgi:hypothetical protein
MTPQDFFSTQGPQAVPLQTGRPYQRLLHVRYAAVIKRFLSSFFGNKKMEFVEAREQVERTGRAEAKLEVGGNRHRRGRRPGAATHRLPLPPPHTH